MKTHQVPNANDVFLTTNGICSLSKGLGGLDHFELAEFPQELYKNCAGLASSIMSTAAAGATTQLAARGGRWNE